MAAHFLYQVLGLIAVLFVLIAGAPRGYADEFTDISLRSGPNLKPQFEEELQDKDVDAAFEYYRKQGYDPDLREITEFGFRAVSTKDSYRLFFIAFPPPRPSLQPRLKMKSALSYRLASNENEKGNFGHVFHNSPKNRRPSHKSKKWWMAKYSPVTTC